MDTVDITSFLEAHLAAPPPVMHVDLPISAQRHYAATPASVLCS
jgi:hypothetical protein